VSAERPFLPGAASGIVLSTVQKALAFTARAIGAVRLLAADQRIPKPLRGLVVLGALPIPGPVDEAVLLVAAGLLFAFYRRPLHEAWDRARDRRTA
jgi:hypothetical protein